MQQIPLEDIQRFVARYAVLGAFRGCPQGTSGVARRYMGGLLLRPFATVEELAFQEALNRATAELREAMPGREWGFARKGLNIFLRDCFYN